MTLIRHVHAYTIPAAFSLLPVVMESPAAHAMLLAIGLQESQFLHRRQMRNGPARGFWQFEGGPRSALAGLKKLPQTEPALSSALRTLRYPAATHLTVLDLQALLEHNDTLACVCARLLLWTLPAALPARDQPDEAWQQYLKGWKPGEAKPETWARYFATAWDIVTAKEHT